MSRPMAGLFLCDVTQVHNETDAKGRLYKLYHLVHHQQGLIRYVNDDSQSGIVFMQETMPGSSESTVSG